MNINRKIHENAGKIKLIIIMTLAVLLIFRFYLNSEGVSDINLNTAETDIDIFSLFFFGTGILPHFLIPLETVAVFLNKKGAIMISIISILFSAPLILLYCSTIFPFILAGLSGEGWDGIFMVIAEFVSNTVFCISAGVVILIKGA